MNRFGYKLQFDNQVDLDKADFGLYARALEAEPGLSACISCGTCSAVCTAHPHNGFNFRKLSHSLRMGLKENLAKEVYKCFLCGNCGLVCPRGIIPRKVNLFLQKILINQTAYVP